MSSPQFQLFQLGKKIKSIYVANVTGSGDSNSLPRICLETILDEFPNAKRFTLDGHPIPFLKDANGCIIHPLCIAFYPDKTLEIIEDIPESTNIVGAASSTKTLDIQAYQDLPSYSEALSDSLHSTLNIGSLAKTSIGSKVAYTRGNQESHVKDENYDNKTILHEVTHHSIYNEKAQHEFEDVLKANGGSIDTHLGKVLFKPNSRIALKEFFDSLAVSNQVFNLFNLDINFDWRFNSTDLELFRDLILTSRVVTLRLNLRLFQPSLYDKLFSLSRQYETIFRITELESLRDFHIVLPSSFVDLSSLQPKRSPHLQKLSYELTPQSMGLRAFCDFTNSLKSDKYLSKLNLVSKSIGNEGIVALSEALKTNIGLTILDLGSNSIGKEGAIALSEALKTNTGLTTLYLWNNLIEDEGAASLSEALKINTILTTLSLKYNPIKKEGAIALSEALKTNTCLKTLDLGWGSIEREGAIALSEALKINTCLTTLDLENNLIGNEGAIALFEALRINATLTTLDMRCNSIGEEGAVSLSETLRVNIILTTLYLCNNYTGDVGVFELSEALKINNSLTTLYLGSNSIQDIGAIALSEVLRTNTSLASLNLRYNSIGNEGAAALRERIKSHDFFNLAI